MNKRVGLIGTVTHDVISSDSGMHYQDLGGILYQTAALSGLNTEVVLYANIGQDLAPRVEKILGKWPAVDASGMRRVPSPSNFVRLHYPESGERTEVLESVVPAVESVRVRENLSSLDMLVTVINSGFDILLEEWRKIVHDSECPVWLDIHSLALSKEIGQPRKYVPLPEWEIWVKNMTYVQANGMELSCMLGHPGKTLTHDDFLAFSARAFVQGVKAVFITQGREGVMVMTPEESKRMSFPEPVDVRDTTGCGDVFCAAAVARLVRGADLVEAARFGVQLAARAAEVKGVEATYALASKFAAGF